MGVRGVRDTDKAGVVNPAHAGTPSAESPSLVATLRGEGIFTDVWNKEPRVLRGAVDPARHISSGAIAERLGGGNLVLDRVSDWHRPTRDLVEEIEAAIPVALSSYVFWTTPGTHTTSPRHDVSHAVTVQLEGDAEWRPCSAERGAGADGGLWSARTFGLEAGDVLYLPQGRPYDVFAHDRGSLHLTLTLTEPDADDLFEALATYLFANDWELAHRFHVTAPGESTEGMRSALLGLAGEREDDPWVRAALTVMRAATASS